MGSRRHLMLLGLLGCRGALDAPTTPPPPPQPQPISHGVLLEAPDPRCGDEPLGALHATDPGYLIGPEEMVGRVMRDHRLDFTRCVLRRRHELPEIGGKLLVTIRIDAAGQIAHVQTRGPDAELDRCVCAAVLALSFEPLRSASVTYPLYFAP